MDSVNLIKKRLVEEYAHQKNVLQNVLESPRPYYYDVQSLIKDLWRKELEIISITGTIYNGL